MTEQDDPAPGDRVTGTFLVTHADEGSAILQDAASSRVHTLASNPGLTSETVVEGTLRAQQPFGATWELVERETVKEIPVETTDLSPTRQSREAAQQQAVGELTRIERAGEGELHVITVPEDETDGAVADLRDDETTHLQAARVGADRVEIRSAPGLVVVRYLPT